MHTGLQLLSITALSSLQVRVMHQLRQQYSGYGHAELLLDLMQGMLLATGPTLVLHFLMKSQRRFATQSSLNGKGLFKDRNWLITLPTFKPECTGLLQGKDDNQSRAHPIYGYT